MDKGVIQSSRVPAPIKPGFAGVPRDWRLVPKRATQEMVEAVYAEHEDGSVPGVYTMWDVMLEAAPTPPVPLRLDDEYLLHLALLHGLGSQFPVFQKQLVRFAREVLKAGAHWET